MKPSHLSKTLVCLFVLLAITASPVVGDDLHVRVLGQSVSTSERLLGLDGHTGLGTYVGFEKEVSRRWGLELGVGAAEMEFSTRGLIFLSMVDYGDAVIETDLRWTPVTLAANFHLTPNSAVDLYLAPRVGWAFVEDLDQRTTILSTIRIPFATSIAAPEPIPASQEVPLDDAFIYGARLGLDWPIGDGGWNVSGAVDYTVMATAISDLNYKLDRDIDPLGVGFGLAYTW